MKRMNKLYVIRKRLIKALLGFLFALLLLGQWKVNLFANSDSTNNKAEISEDVGGKKERLKKEIAGGDENHYGAKGLVDRLISKSSIRPIVIPLLLVIFVILFSFIIVEILIRKKPPRE